MICAKQGDAFHCPTKWELWRAILGLLPWGRAWQTHEARVYATDENGDPVLEQLTVQEQYWAAFAEVLEFMHQRACALVNEFFCDTMSETAAEWHREWGFPDACEPYESVCEKMRDLGGARCADLVALAASRGWVIECRDCHGNYGAPADCAVADCAADCDCPENQVWITVKVAKSPAAVAPVETQQVADCAVSDCNTACTADVSGLICLIERVRHAHLVMHYEID